MSDLDEPIVHVIDDDAGMRDSIAFLLRADNIACETYDSAQAFLDAIDVETPCCAVVDIRMPGMSGMDLQRELGRLGCDVVLIFITGHGDVELAVRAMREGALNFIQKPFKDQELLDSVRVGLQELEKRLDRAVSLRTLQERYASLTPREQQVMHCVAEGMANKVIAMDLAVSQRTVEIHRARVMKKMKARTLADLVKAELMLRAGGSSSD